MDADEVRDWKASYNEDYDTELQEIEETLHEALQAQQYITRDQLTKVVEWKLGEGVVRQFLSCTVGDSQGFAGIEIRVQYVVE